MSTVVEKHEPSYTYANLSFTRISNAELMGEVDAWKTALPLFPYGDVTAIIR